VNPRQPVVSGERLIKALRKQGWEAFVNAAATSA
jgi:predicted RNA binding protein YcfA (HicA-like mRNA interferase family)